MKNNESVSKQRKVPAILSWEEQESLLKQPNPKAPTGLRNLCIMKLMLDAGLRLSEVINLRPADVNIENRSLYIQEIGSKDQRILWLGENTLESLKQWLKIRPEGEYLFCTLKGKRLDDRYIREMVKRLALKAGVKKNIFPHSLRHTFAADLYRRTRNICIVQEALGHADLSTTMIYAYLIEEDLETALKIFVRERRHEPSPGTAVAPLFAVDFNKKEVGTQEYRDARGTDNPVADTEKTINATDDISVAEPENDLAGRATADSSNNTITEKNIVSMHAIKCKCGNILSRRVEHCPECGKNIEVLLEELRQDFYRINFKRNPNKQNNI